MNVHCRTNLDLPGEERPTDLPAVPRVGDYIRSATDWPGGFHLQLRVCDVTWVKHAHGGWLPVIELHDGQRRSLRQFYRWYAPLVGKTVAAFI